MLGRNPLVIKTGLGFNYHVGGFPVFSRPSSRTAHNNDTYIKSCGPIFDEYRLKLKDRYRRIKHFIWSYEKFHNIEKPSFNKEAVESFNINTIIPVEEFKIIEDKNNKIWLETKEKEMYYFYKSTLVVAIETETQNETYFDYLDVRHARQEFPFLYNKGNR